MRSGRLTGAALAALVGLAMEAKGAGLLVPADPGIPPLAIKYLRVDTTIDNQAATTRVVQEFQNSTNSNLECTYIFPLPKGAAIRDFALYIGGKRMKGELVEKDKARQVYEEIVRRMRDPGLLEYMDGNLLRLRIFPVPAKGTQKVELEYTEMVPMDSGLAEYVFPLRIGERASKTLEDFTVSVRIKSGSPLKTVYSPTHEVGVARPSDHEAVAGMETKAALLDRDFQLFWAVGEKDFGLSLMTYRPDPDQPGMFLMLISPRSDMNEAERVPRDLVLVLDTSGSMKEGGKLEQAKKALRFCIDQLDRKDRFAVIQFSTMAQAFAGGWSDASEANTRKARDWIDPFEASGGTNVSEALSKTFALPFDESRPAMVLFLTDGRPTVDVTDLEALAKTVKDHNKRNLRIFTFGVGDDVNTHLLDRMSGDTGGLPEYVRPGEAIDGKMTRLFSKMSHPVLTELAIEVPKVQIIEMYPKQAPDLFRGSQAVVVGAYKGDGDSVIRLKGRVGKKQQEFTYEGTFPKKTTDRSFIGALYAHRKIGFLLDQIRLHGENKELKDEVTRLSVAYGIETPYTSYLVLENQEQYKQYGVTLGGAVRTGGGTSGPPPTVAPSPVPMTTSLAPAAKPAEEAKRKADRVEIAYAAGFARGKASGEKEAPRPDSAPSAPQKGQQTARQSAPAATGYHFESGAAPAGVRFDADDLKSADTGKTAVDIAQAIQRLRQAENLGRDSRAARKVEQRGGRPFINYRGVWVDDRFQGTERLTKVKWGSEAYFRLAREKQELREILSLGERVVLVTAPGKAVAIDPDEGVEKLSDDEFKALFTETTK